LPSLSKIEIERPRIETLPQSVADRIAAGEVVERPAAVIKELVENAIDAGATKIQVIVTDAGRTLLKVVDNGIGMTAAELTASVGRHATSKLRRFEDLEALETFGFRGEALPSIAAVSRLDILSCAHGEEIGARLKISAGVIESCEPAACSRGTTVAVSHLFHNVPARRKFLRSDATEFKWIAAVFKHFALVFPSIEFELYRGEVLVYQLPSETPRGRITGMFGDDLAEDMAAIDHRQNYMHITGFITPPSSVLKSGGEQYLFVNSRPIASPRLNRAILNALEPYLTVGGQPIYIVNIQCPPDKFDINVHPAKKEVRFADEQLVYNALWGAIRRALGESLAPHGLPAADKASSMPGSNAAGSGAATSRTHIIARREASSEHIVVKLPVEAPAHLTPYIPVARPSGRAGAPNLPFPYNPKVDKSIAEDILPDETSARLSAVANVETTTSEGPVIFQLFNTYLVSPLTTGIVFIDQHIAHERILYEQALNAMERIPWLSQQLLFPSSFAVSVEDAALVEEIKPLLRAMGFDIESFGPREYRILSVPAGLKISNERGILLEIIDELHENGGLKSAGDPRRTLAAAFACRAALKAGIALEPEERHRLIDDLFQTSDPEFCPHGRPIYHVLSKKEIEKWFKR